MIWQRSQPLVHPNSCVLVGDQDERNKQEDNCQKDPVSSLSAFLYNTKVVRVQIVNKGRMTYFGIIPPSKFIITSIVFTRAPL